MWRIIVLNLKPLTLSFLLIGTGLSMMARPVYRTLRRTLDQIQTNLIWNVMADREFREESGACVARLKCPSAGIDSLISFDATQENLWRYPCWSRNSVKPWEHGLIIVQGHRDAHFRNLNHIAEGDKVLLETGEGHTDTYTASSSEIVKKEDLAWSVEEKKNQDGLLLISCYPFRFTGPAPYRYLVWLKKLETE